MGLPPDDEALALMRSYAAHLSERQLRVLLVQSKSFEDWAVAIYEQALKKKRAMKRQHQRDLQRYRQRNQKRDALGRYIAA